MADEHGLRIKARLPSPKFLKTFAPSPPHPSIPSLCIATMRFIHSTLLLTLGLSALTKAAPDALRLPTKDAKFTRSRSLMNKAIECPNGIKGKKGGIVLLVPGTAETGPESFLHGPYIEQLPHEGDGFDVCYVSPPDRALNDAQINGEYVANAIMHLAPQSKTKKIKVLGHSQGGGLNIPWALIFWPSARKVVESFVGLAPDFHGTTILPYPACAVQTLVSVGQGCSVAFLQQEAGSHYLDAQLKFLTQAIVPTTSVITELDEIVIPSNISCRLSGASEFLLQDSDVCGQLHVVDHLGLIGDPAAYAIAVDAFTHKSGKASLKRFNQTNCFGKNLLDLNDVAPAVQFLAGLGTGVVLSGGAPKPPKEPALKPYVCKAGAATKCSK